MEGVCQRRVSDERKTLIARGSIVAHRAEAREGMDMTALRQIDFETAKRIAEAKGLVPAVVKGTRTLRFSRADNERMDFITWDEFERAAISRRLAVYESGGWMKLMRRD